MPSDQLITADDVDEAVQHAVDTLGQGLASAWGNQAGGLEWTCWETAERLCGLVSYAAQLAPRASLLDATLPLSRQARRPGGPASAVHVNPDAGAAGLLLVLEAAGALLAAIVPTKSPQMRAYHAYGVSDPAGFAAMGITETLVHTYDMAQGLALPWTPPAGICARILTRLFPSTPAHADPWPALLWATGRGDLPGHPRLTTWRWDSTVRP